MPAGSSDLNKITYISSIHKLKLNPIGNFARNASLRKSLNIESLLDDRKWDIEPNRNVGHPPRIYSPKNVIEIDARSRCLRAE